MATFKNILKSLQRFFRNPDPRFELYYEATEGLEELLEEQSQKIKEKAKFLYKITKNNGWRRHGAAGTKLQVYINDLFFQQVLTNKGISPGAKIRQKKWGSERNPVPSNLEEIFLLLYCLDLQNYEERKKYLLEEEGEDCSHKGSKHFFLYFEEKFLKTKKEISSEASISVQELILRPQLTTAPVKPQKEIGANEIKDFLAALKDFLKNSEWEKLGKTFFGKNKVPKYINKMRIILNNKFSDLEKFNSIKDIIAQSYKHKSFFRNKKTHAFYEALYRTIHSDTQLDLATALNQKLYIAGLATPCVQNALIENNQSTSRLTLISDKKIENTTMPPTTTTLLSILTATRPTKRTTPLVTAAPITLSAGSKTIFPCLPSLPTSFSDPFNSVEPLFPHISNIRSRQ
jgi:hypothetical protein